MPCGATALTAQVNLLTILMLSMLLGWRTTLPTSRLALPVSFTVINSFLNNTITDVLHLNCFKLRRYRGNLKKFVQQVPEAKSYYTIEAAEDYRFKLPDPPLLEGVKTKEKSLLKM
jgi:elongation factor 3